MENYNEIHEHYDSYKFNIFGNYDEIVELFKDCGLTNLVDYSPSQLVKFFKDKYSINCYNYDEVFCEKMIIKLKELKKFFDNLKRL